MAEKNCKECDTTFAPYHPKHLFCSKLCYNKNRYRRKRPQIRASQRVYYLRHQPKLVAYTKRWVEQQTLLRPWAPLLGTAKYRARKQSLLYSLTPEWAAKTWTGFCSLSKIPFILNKKRSLYSPTIDKINPALGYTPDNCRFILFGVNALKYNGNDDDVYKIAEAITISRMDSPAAQHAPTATCAVASCQTDQDSNLLHSNFEFQEKPDAQQNKESCQSTAAESPPH